MKNKKILLTILFLGILSTACVKTNIQDTPTNMKMIEENPTDLIQSTNLTKFENYENIEDVKKVYGDFDELKYIPDGFELKGYQVFNGNKALQIIYQNGADILTYRQSKEIEPKLLNGDQNKYDETTLNYNTNVTILKQSPDLIFVAMYKDDLTNKNKCFMFSEGINQDEFEKIYNSFKEEK